MCIMLSMLKQYDVMSPQRYAILDEGNIILVIKQCVFNFQYSMMLIRKNYGVHCKYHGMTPSTHVAQQFQISYAFKRMSSIYKCYMYKENKETYSAFARL